VDNDVKSCIECAYAPNKGWVKTRKAFFHPPTPVLYSSTLFSLLRMCYFSYRCSHSLPDPIRCSVDESGGFAHY
jgi:hypothetical protein